uniref:Aminotransferase-like plant mobile domain-containing protein n=1 Tax=Fagus sylvatica TaxID=28930 RepID=A0A2N9F348_FAGSY
MDLYPVDDRFSLNRWAPQLAYGEDITILFWLEEHLSHRPPRSFMSRGNPTEVLKGWARLTSITRSFEEMTGFKQFVESQPTEIAKKSILCALVKRWWDTTHTFHIAGVEMTITSYDVYRLTNLRVDGIILTFSAFPARLRPDREYLGMDLGATSANLPSLLLAFSKAPQGTIEEATRMVRAFLLYLIGTTLDCNTSQIVSVRWLHLLVDFQRTAQYNLGRVALANLYAGFDAVSRGATTSFVGPWRIWHVTWNAWVGVKRVGSLTADKRAYSLAQFSHLFEVLGVCAFYMAKRVTRQLGEDEDLVPVPPLQFTLLPYEAPNEVILLWRLGIPLLDLLDEDGDFEEYQRSLMPTLFPPQAVEIIRHTDVLRYPVPEDAHPATYADLNYMFQLCGNMKTMMTDLSRDRFSRPLGSSSRGV